MSIDSAKAYVERMKTDEEFRKKVLACKDAKKRMELVKAEGYDLTEKDMKDVTTGMKEAELRGVYGGIKLSHINDSSDGTCKIGYGIATPGCQTDHH